MQGTQYLLDELVRSSFHSWQSCNLAHSWHETPITVYLPTINNAKIKTWSSIFFHDHLLKQIALLYDWIDTLCDTNFSTKLLHSARNQCVGPNVILVQSAVLAHLFVWGLTTHQPMWVISVRRY